MAYAYSQHTERETMWRTRRGERKCILEKERERKKERETLLRNISSAIPRAFLFDETGGWRYTAAFCAFDCSSQRRRSRTTIGPLVRWSPRSRTRTATASCRGLCSSPPGTWFRRFPANVACSPWHRRQAARVCPTVGRMPAKETANGWKSLKDI